MGLLQSTVRELPHFKSSLLALLVANNLLFLFCQLKKNNTYIDIWWALKFSLLNLTQIFVQHQQGIPIDNRTIGTALVILLWGLRLAIHLGKRHAPVEDYRYAAFRRAWMKTGGKAYYYLMAYFVIFML